MSQKGRHSFVIPKGDTPTRATRNPVVEAADIQSRLRMMGNYSRQTARFGAWPAKQEFAK
jgi:hypothetical protein